VTLNTYIRPFIGPFTGTTRVSQYQKGKTNLDFAEARDSEWQWQQLGHMHVCTSLQTDSHPTTQLFTGRMPFLPPNQQLQSTEGYISDREGNVDDEKSATGAAADCWACRTASWD